MKCCQNCGAKLTELKAPSSWYRRQRCDKCGTRYETTFGDAMGGSSDHIHVTKQPFEAEEIDDA